MRLNSAFILFLTSLALLCGSIAFMFFQALQPVVKIPEFKAGKVNYEVQFDPAQRRESKSEKKPVEQLVFFKEVKQVQKNDPAELKENEEVKLPDIKFRGLITGAVDRVVIESAGKPRVYSEGDQFAGWTIASIQNQEILLKNSGKEHRVVWKVSEYNLGTGSSSGPRSSSRFSRSRGSSMPPRSFSGPPR